MTWQWRKAPEWHYARRQGIGGSDATVIMTGDQDRILNLYLEKIGEREPDDLSTSLPVQIGIATEGLHAAWLERESGFAVRDRNKSFTCADPDFMRCEIDGLTTLPCGQTAIVEFKHVNPFSEIDGVVQRYMPQLHHQMHVCGVSEAILSVFVGTQRHEVYSVSLDEFYLAALIEREEAFWQAVQTKTPPVAMPVIAPPVPPEAMRTVDMQGNNEWASLAADWLENKKAASTFEKAAKGVKALMQPDMGEAYGHGLRCVRAKNGNLSVKEAK